MKVKKVYRIWAYSSRLNLCVLEWYTSMREVKLRAEKLFANGYDYIDDFTSQLDKPTRLSFNFHPDETDLIYYRQLKHKVIQEAEVILKRFPVFGCEATKDICSTCSNLQDDGHCHHEEIVSAEGCSYYEGRSVC